jgi:hypothetical protein
MAELGAAGKVVTMISAIKSRRAAISTGLEWIGRPHSEAQDFEIMDTPIPSAGLKAMVFIGPGTRTWQAPVNAGLVTVTVKMLKRAGYESLNQLPYLELTAPPGLIARDTMANVTNTWDTLSASLTILANGVMVVNIVRPWLYGGGNLFFADDERRRVSDGNLYVADLRITGGPITTGDFVRLVNDTFPLDVLVTATGSPPNVGENLILAAILNKTAPQDQTLKLYVNDVVPSESDTAGTFTEASGSGYAAKSLSGASWSLVNGDPTVASYAAQVFTFSGALGLVYGYYVVQTTSGILLWAERFADGPYDVQVNGTTITVTPTLGAD